MRMFVDTCGLRAKRKLVLGLPRATGDTLGCCRTIGTSRGTPQNVEKISRQSATRLAAASSPKGNPSRAAAPKNSSHHDVRSGVSTQARSPR